MTILTREIEDHEPELEVKTPAPERVSEGPDRIADQIAIIEAVGRSQAMIEFELDGTIISANENFLAAMGYSLAEIEGNHHSMFVDPDHKDSAEYAQFWDALRSGEFQAGEFRRVASGGKEYGIPVNAVALARPGPTSRGPPQPFPAG